MCISLSLAGLSSIAVFHIEAAKKAIKSQKIPFTNISGLWSKFHRLLEGRLKVEWRQIEYICKTKQESPKRIQSSLVRVGPRFLA